MPRHYEDDVTFDPVTVDNSRLPLPIDKVPRHLYEGEVQRVFDGERITTRERIDGRVHETSTDSDTAVDKITNITINEDSLGSSNVTFEFGENNIICRDDNGNIRAKFGQISTGNNFGFANYNSSGATLMNISGNTASLAGWIVNTSFISKTNTTTGHTLGLYADDEPRLQLKVNSSTLLKAGMLSSTKAGFELFKTNGTSIFKVNEDGADIAGWKFTNTKLASDVDSQDRIELNSTDMRIAVMKDDNSTLTAMGYLGGLVKNNSIGNEITNVGGGSSLCTITIGAITTDEHADAFNPDTLVGLQYYIASTNTGSISGGLRGLVSANTYNTITIAGTGVYNAIGQSFSMGDKWYVLKFATDDYGFWAAQSDKMRIDGDVEYDSGDWLIHSDGALKFSTGAGLEVMRLGTHTGKRGLFIGSNLNSDPPLAEYTGSKILIGDESDEFLRYTTAGGLEISGNITVTDPGDTSTTAHDDFKASELDTGVWDIIGNTTQVSTPTGIGFHDTSDDANWDSGIRWANSFQREHAPSFYWDFKIVTIGANNNFEMIGWFANKTSMAHSNLVYGIYLYDNDIVWRYGTNAGDYGSVNSDYMPGSAGSGTDPLIVGAKYRLVIQVITGGGAFGYIYQNGDYTTPWDTYIWQTGTQTELYLGSIYYNGTAPKCEHQNMTGGNLQPAVSTQISGGLIKTGKIESTDGNTFFDLNNNIIQMEDNSSDTRLTLGNYTGNDYALRIARPGIDLDANTVADDMIFNSDWAIPKVNVLFGGAKENTAGSGLLDTAYATWVSGNCTSNNNAGTSMTDSSRFGNDAWEVNEWVGSTVVRTNAGYNSSTDTMDTSMRAYGIITSNTTNTLTHVALAGGYPGSQNSSSDGNDWDNGDTYTIAPKMWGKFSKSDSFYVGTKKLKTSYSSSNWIENSEGTTMAVFPYLHDKVNKFIRLSAFLSAETSLRLGIYRYTWNTHDTAKKLQLELAGVRDKGRFMYTTTFINDLIKGDAVWTDNVNGTTFGQAAWHVCTDSSVEPNDMGVAWLQTDLNQGNQASNFVEIYERFPFMKIANTSNVDGAYKVATMDLTSHLQSTYKLRHGDLYIIRLTGGRTSDTESSTDDSHLVIQPYVTIHGYDFDAIDNNDST